MKKRTSTTSLLTFVAGAIFGVSIFVLLSFASGPNAPAALPLGSAIPLDSAKVYVQKFRQHYPNALKAIAIDKDQYNAMVTLLTSTPGLAGFRVYSGEDFSHGKVAIVVGMTSTGTDITTAGQIYLTNIKNAGPCPTLCDSGSPLY